MVVDFSGKNEYIIDNRTPHTSQRCAPGETFFYQDQDTVAHKTADLLPALKDDPTARQRRSLHRCPFHYRDTGFETSLPYSMILSIHFSVSESCFVNIGISHRHRSLPRSGKLSGHTNLFSLRKRAVSCKVKIRQSFLVQERLPV